MDLEKESRGIAEKFEEIHRLAERHKITTQRLKDNQEFFRIAWDLQQEIEDNKYPRDNITFLHHKLMGNDRYAYLQTMRPAMFAAALAGKLKFGQNDDVSKLLDAYFNGKEDPESIKKNIEQLLFDKVKESMSKVEEVAEQQKHEPEPEAIAPDFIPPRDEFEKQKYFEGLLQEIEKKIKAGEKETRKNNFEESDSE